MTFHCPEKYRIRSGAFGTDKGDPFGAFWIPQPRGAPLRILATDGADADAQGWEHVSVSLPNRCPTWEEMCVAKSLFWDEDDCVMQLHPPRSSYVNDHPYCLHLWRPVALPIPQPPTILVGYGRSK
jgi:hypothetical protein